VSFRPLPGHVSKGQRLAVWRSRVAPAQLVELDQRGIQPIEIEDGFIRSVGLGADCIPPLSIVADRLGIYFDPSRESELECLFNEGSFSADLLRRAQQMREVIVDGELSKYEASSAISVRLPHRPGSILVPGQVEDDRSVVCGGGDIRNNLELLRRVRQEAPDRYIIYKPHPDVEAGHRIGAISDQICLTLADEIVRDVPISALISAVDEVHVNTSLAGFEALLRGKRVTTYGVPFYAGWGLTRDLGAVPARRAARRSLDELVAAALLVYPRYVDPVTGLPCPPEVLVDRLARGAGESKEGILVPLRRLQGRSRRYLSTILSKLS
jgi:capsular polysaccharide export protein